MDSNNKVPGNVLENMRLEKLKKQVVQLQEEINLLKPEDVVLRKRYEELLELWNAEIEKLNGRGL